MCRCVQPQNTHARGVLAAGIFTNIVIITPKKKNVCWCCPLSTWTTLFPCCANQVQIDDFKNTKTMKVALLNAPFVSNMRQILESILKASWVNRIFPKQQDRFHWLIIVGVKCSHLPSVFEIYPPNDISLLVANVHRVKCILEIRLFCKASLQSQFPCRSNILSATGDRFRHLKNYLYFFIYLWRYFSHLRASSLLTLN